MKREVEEKKREVEEMKRDLKKREIEEMKREVEELKFEAMTRMMTAQLQSRNYNRLGQISPYYGNS